MPPYALEWLLVTTIVVMLIVWGAIAFVLLRELMTPYGEED